MSSETKKFGFDWRFRRIDSNQWKEQFVHPLLFRHHYFTLFHHSVDDLISADLWLEHNTWKLFDSHKSTAFSGWFSPCDGWIKQYYTCVSETAAAVQLYCTQQNTDQLLVWQNKNISLYLNWFVVRILYETTETIMMGVTSDSDVEVWRPCGGETVSWADQWWHCLLWCD